MSGRKTGPRVDLVGRRFGRLVVVAFDGMASRSTSKWVCVCDCGSRPTVSGQHLRNGGIRSCGCLRREVAALVRRSHGRSLTAEYTTWSSMKSRCENRNDRSFKRYGAVGISVCGRWRDSFENFLHDMGPRPAGRSIDRINGAGNYEPGNCRWATRSEQNLNRRPWKKKSPASTGPTQKGSV